MRSHTVTIKPLRLPFDAKLRMPGSKSHANRAIICACLAKGTTTITNATPCDDVIFLVQNLKKMGFKIAWKDMRSGMLRVQGGIPKKNDESDGKPVTLHCGNAGTTLRFLTSLACITPGDWIITGNEHMRRRPIGDLTESLQQLGAEIDDSNGCPPVRIRGGTIKGGHITLNASKSSQFLTSLLLCSPVLEQLEIDLSHFVSSMPYIHLTQKVQKDFGIKFSNKLDLMTNKILLKRQQYAPPSSKPYPIEGDWSAYGAFLVLAQLTDSTIKSDNLSEQSEQGDSKLPRAIKELAEEGEVTIDCIDFPDQVMNLAVLAAYRNGTTILKHVQNLRYKECDRLAVITKELSKAGVDIEEHPDHLLIKGLRKMPTKKVTLDPHDDHRMAMAFAVLGCVRPGITIKNPECVSKSYPHFFEDLQSLHSSPMCIALVGMRGVGKTTIGKEFEKRMRLKHIDTDAVFIRAHGPIRSFVEKRGWRAFRQKEERITLESIRPRSVVSLGGGAIESKRTRELLKGNSVVIFLKATPSLIIKRLKKEGRPPLTNRSLEEEVRIIMKKRTPLYDSVADIVIDDQGSKANVTSRVISSLRERCTL